MWLAIVFTSLLGLNRSLVHEKDQGCLDALLLAPVDRPVIFFGKAIGNLLFLLIVEVFVTPLFMIIFNAGKYSQGPRDLGLPRSRAPGRVPSASRESARCLPLCR